jgi:hypothetical protein
LNKTFVFYNLSRGHQNTHKILKRKQRNDTQYNNKDRFDGQRFGKLKVAIWNVRGIVEKTGELQTELLKRKIDIAIIRETVVLCLTVYKCYLLSSFSVLELSTWARLAHKLLFPYRKLANKINIIFHPSHPFLHISLKIYEGNTVVNFENWPSFRTGNISYPLLRMKDITFTENKNREKKGSPWHYIFRLFIPRRRTSRPNSVLWLCQLLDNRTVKSRIPAGAGYISLKQIFQLDSGAQRVYYSVCLGIPFPGNKLAGTWIW